MAASRRSARSCEGDRGRTTTTTSTRCSAKQKTQWQRESHQVECCAPFPRSRPQIECCPFPSKRHVTSTFDACDVDINSSRRDESVTSFNKPTNAREVRSAGRRRWKGGGGRRRQRSRLPWISAPTRRGPDGGAPCRRGALLRRARGAQSASTRTFGLTSRSDVNARGRGVQRGRGAASLRSRRASSG